MPISATLSRTRSSAGARDPSGSASSIGCGRSGADSFDRALRRRVFGFRLVELLLDLGEVIGVERLCHLAQGAPSFFRRQLALLEVDADEAHPFRIAD